ncbi:hypothetical protein ACFL2J_05960 [Candidatus Omnitrophota bacterium]
MVKHMVLNKKNIIAIITVCIFALLISGLISSYAQEEVEDTIRTQKGLRFTVPEDWPIEERNGVVAPIPIEEYIDIKFKRIISQLDSFKKDLSSKFEKINSDSDVSKYELSGKFDELKSSIESATQDSQELFVSLDTLEAKLSSVEESLRDLSLKLKASEVKDENMAELYKDIESRIGQLETDVENMEYHSVPEGDQSWY